MVLGDRKLWTDSHFELSWNINVTCNIEVKKRRKAEARWQKNIKIKQQHNAVTKDHTRPIITR